MGPKHPLSGEMLIVVESVAKSRAPHQPVPGEGDSRRVTPQLSLRSRKPAPPLARGESQFIVLTLVGFSLFIRLVRAFAQR